MDSMMERLRQVWASPSFIICRRVISLVVCTSAIVLFLWLIFAKSGDTADQLGQDWDKVALRVIALVIITMFIFMLYYVFDSNIRDWCHNSQTLEDDSLNDTEEHVGEHRVRIDPDSDPDTVGNITESPSKNTVPLTSRASDSCQSLSESVASMAVNGNLGAMVAAANERLSVSV